MNNFVDLYKSLICKILELNGSEDAYLETNILTEYFGCRELSNDDCNAIAQSIINKCPLQYYIEYTYVKNIKILINKNVLLPGPEMEVMLNTCSKYIKAKHSILDMCTGSGVVSTILAQENVDCHFFATDISCKALEVAKDNFELYKLKNVQLLRGNLFEPILEAGINQFDIIIANPPYCKSGNIVNLPDQVGKFAPKLAIDGGEDGLYFHRIIICESTKFLKIRGYIILQNEVDQLKDISKILIDNNYEIIEIAKNHLNQERIIVGRLRENI